MPRTLDLDPSAAGRQTTIAVTGGTFSAADDGTVAFTPAAGFSGKATAAYVVRDFFFRRSNEATLTVTVKPAPAPIVQLFSFETGIDGWALSGGTGTLTQSSAWSTSTSRASSLQIDVTSEGWFSGPLPAAVDLTGKTAVRLDLQTLGSQTYRKLSIQVGDAWLWCEDNDGRREHAAGDGRYGHDRPHDRRLHGAGSDKAPPGQPLPPARDVPNRQRAGRVVGQFCLTG